MNNIFFIKLINNEEIATLSRDIIFSLFDFEDEYTIIKIQQLEEIENASEEVLMNQIMNDFPLIKLLFAVSNIISSSKNISSFIELCHEQKNEIEEIFESIPDEDLKRFVNYYETKRTFLINKIKEIFKLKNFEEESLIKKLPYTTKTKISEEFDISLPTLNNWLNELFENRFDKKRRIYLSDYIEIYNKFMGEKGNYIDLTRVDSINSKKKKYTKFDIAEDLNPNSKDKSGTLKIVKRNINRDESLNFYNHHDVFPFSLAKKVMDKLYGLKSE